MVLSEGSSEMGMDSKSRTPFGRISPVTVSMVKLTEFWDGIISYLISELGESFSSSSSARTSKGSAKLQSKRKL